MIFQLKFSKTGYLKFLSHLDMMEVFRRAFRRSEIALVYSKGFNPSPKMAIANPLPVGIESVAEYLQCETEEDLEASELMERLNAMLPEGIRIIAAVSTESSKSIVAEILWSKYRITFPEGVDPEACREAVANLLSRKEVKIWKKTKRRRGRETVEVEKDVRPAIADICVEEGHPLQMRVMLQTGDGLFLKATDFLKILFAEPEFDLDEVEITRIAQRTAEGDVDERFGLI
jgi:radical SAM-linked protein